MIQLLYIKDDEVKVIHKIADELIEDEQWEVIKGILKNLVDKGVKK